jgi:AraC family transcriptional regulator of adaptative response/methylated-DNA-[protein]-cysteine methyltransferase
MRTFLHPVHTESSNPMPANAALDESLCWDAVLRRDSAQDGEFFFGVLTTGVYCRPSCAARRPLRENVRFYREASEAERDGLRPCLRCRPLASVNRDPNAERIRKICRYIEAHISDIDSGSLSLEQLATRAELSRFHFLRSFQAVVGVTPKQYVEACRVRQLKTELRKSSDNRAGHVTAAIYDAGFGSSSRVYERADTHLGMTPKQYRDGGANLIITYTMTESAAGKLMIGATDRGICFVQFGENREDLLRALEAEYPAALLESMRDPAPAVFRQWMIALSAHLAGRQPHLDLPLDIRATAFQMRVWNYLQSIPYGETRSYSEVAGAIGRPKATRAVANACARNTVAILIPCHRVIRGTGDLGGYRWGVERKRSILETEVRNITTAINGL